MNNFIERLRSAFVYYIYADHNQSDSVKNELKMLIDKADKNSFILNVGSGGSRIHPAVKNLDIFPGKYVDYVASADNIPIKDEMVDIVITQECFEHIVHVQEAMREIYRITKKQGVLFFQVPFIIGYHPGPTDLWRFTKEGIVQIVKSEGFEVKKIGITVGSATGFYRIAVEFFAIFFSVFSDKLYIPFKGFFSLIFYPIKYFDSYVKYSSRNDRVAGGYFLIAQK